MFRAIWASWSDVGSSVGSHLLKYKAAALRTTTSRDRGLSIWPTPNLNAIWIFRFFARLDQSVGVYFHGCGRPPLFTWSTAWAQNVVDLRRPAARARVLNFVETSLLTVWMSGVCFYFRIAMECDPTGDTYSGKSKYELFQPTPLPGRSLVSVRTSATSRWVSDTFVSDTRRF